MFICATSVTPNLGVKRRVEVTPRSSSEYSELT